jgi:TRAP transporter TAXI family solute receptor
MRSVEESMGILRLAAAVLASVLMTSAAPAQTVTIGTAQVGSLSNSVGNALGKVVTDEAGLRMRVVPYGGGQQFLPLIGKQEVDIAVAGASDALFAYQGVADFSGHPSPNMRSLGVVFPFNIGWFVKKDSPYQSLTELRGKKVPVGFTANTAQQRSFLAGLAADGMKPTDFDGVPVAHVVRAADDFMQGKTEATTFALGAGKVAEVDTKVGGIRWLNTNGTPDGLKRLREVMPTAYVALLNPAPGLVGIHAPTSLLFEDYVVVTGSHLSEEAAYKIASVLYESQSKLASIVKAYERYDRNELARDRQIPFHPGAIKFYREKGIWKQ